VDRGATDGTGPAEAAQSTDDPEAEDDLNRAGRAELLAEENRRLRAEYARAQQARYRRTAAGLAAIGMLAVLGGLVFPDGREVLFVLAATGLFGGVLTLYLTPGQFVSADVGERVYAAMAANEAAIAGDLGLSELRVYVPAGGSTARLYLPQRATFELPTEPDSPVLVDEESRGLWLEATGSFLFEEFEQALAGGLADAPPSLAAQLADGVVEQFELATAVEPDVETDGGRASFAVSGSAFGDVDRIDHPVASFLAVGFAVAMDRPIRVAVTASDGRTDWLVTCRWETPDE
jgi:hypothetical protein